MASAYANSAIRQFVASANQCSLDSRFPRNRIFTASLDAQIGGTRLGHAEINALVALSSERHYPELTVYASLEPCHLCLAAATMSRVGGLRYAGADPYAGAVGKLLPNPFLEQYPLRVDGPLPGLAGLFPELLHARSDVAREELELDPLRRQPQRRLPPAGAHATQHDADVLRTRGDLTRSGAWQLAACDRRLARTRPLDRQP